MKLVRQNIVAGCCAGTAVLAPRKVDKGASQD